MIRMGLFHQLSKAQSTLHRPVAVAASAGNGCYMALCTFNQQSDSTLQQSVLCELCVSSSHFN